MAEVSAKLVKQLRDATGAGMMDCKKALAASNSDMEEAKTWLRQKGLAKADKVSTRTALEGLVDSYIHTGGHVGVLVEVNCETDFVARRDEFKALVRNVAMQIAAYPNVEYVKVSDIPPEVVAREKEIEMGKDDLGNKPANVKEKIVQGRIDKRLKEMSLLDQDFIRDSSITVEEMVKQTIAQLGENIQVRRFVRFTLGEGLEREESNFAEEVASQMGKSKADSPSKAEPEPSSQEPTNGKASKADEQEASEAVAEEPETPVEEVELNVQISSEEKSILEAYCKQTQQDPADVLRELIRGLKKKL